MLMVYLIIRNRLKYFLSVCAYIRIYLFQIKLNDFIDEKKMK